jgi:anti-sigma factor RsiW
MAMKPMAKKPSLTDEELTNLVAYLDGELDEHSARAVEAKLSLDAGARLEAETLRQMWAVLDYLARPEASATFTSKTLDRVSSLRPAKASATMARSGDRVITGGSRWWAFGIGWAAAVILAGIVGFGGVNLATQRQRLAVQANQAPADLDGKLVHDLRLIENKRLYENVEDIHFLGVLDDPDLFGDEG